MSKRRQSVSGPVQNIKRHRTSPHILVMSPATQDFFKLASSTLSTLRIGCEVHWKLARPELIRTAIYVMLIHTRVSDITNITETQLWFRNGSKFICEVDDRYSFATNGGPTITIPWALFNEMNKKGTLLTKRVKELEKEKQERETKT